MPVLKSNLGPNRQPSPARSPRAVGSFRILALGLMALGMQALGHKAFAQDPAVVGRWGSLIKAELVPIHVMLLPNGKIMYWDRHDQGTHDMTPRIWDPGANTTTKAPNPGYDMFCAGHSQLRNGDVLIAGGHQQDFFGEDKMRIYNWRTNTFDAGLPNMNAGRWYPTATTLANGDVLITSGNTTGQTAFNEIPQVYEYRTRTLRTLTGAQQVIGLYPWMFVRPGNKVFLAGEDSLTRMLDVSGTGKWTTIGMTRSGKNRNYGSAVMYEPGKVMICGGGRQPPLASVETIDLNEGAPAWKFSDSMHFARRHQTAVMLPDGKVIVTGGTSGRGDNNVVGAVFNAEMWDPATGHWTVLAPASTVRIYHSFSLLLPDGRILTGGGGHPGEESNYLSEHPDFEIYEPPYLFKGTRPVIDAAPDTLFYGKTFALSTKVAGAPKVSLLRLAAVTHAFDHNANFNRLAVTRQSATSLLVTPPSDSALDQPGAHMLFLLDEAGIPSLAKIVWVTSPAGGSPLIAQPRGAGAFRLTVAGNRLRVAGLELAADAECILLNGRGERVAVLKRAAGPEFRLPAHGLAGAYMAVVRMGNRKHSGRIFIP
ncbi:MAG: Galactose oxidase precursor [Fibrobacteres bacterium]|nr:Galactose oxidase precursor [Fibrobacterota bacterium]